MKLRNKKTGEIVEFNSEHKDSLADFGGKLLVETRRGKEHSYDTLAELNEEWEDYEPKEPLIKDEQKRDSLLHFASLIGVNTFTFQSVHNCFIHTFCDGVTYSIDFDNSVGLEDIEIYTTYTIAELCGGEE